LLYCCNQWLTNIVSYRQPVVFAWQLNFKGNPYRLCHIAFRGHTADRNSFVD
jgi:hypothetical protein